MVGVGMVHSLDNGFLGEGDSGIVLGQDEHFIIRPYHRVLFRSELECSVPFPNSKKDPVLEVEHKIIEPLLLPVTPVEV